MQNSLHVKFEYMEAVQAKKQLLLFQRDVLETSEHLKNFADLRKKHYAVSNKIRIGFSQLGKEIQAIENSFPNLEEKHHHEHHNHEEFNEIIEKPKTEKVEQIKKRKHISNELEEIRAKLAALG